MVVDRRASTWSHARFSDLGDYLVPGDCLVLNDTRVIPARLIGRRLTGGRAEALLLRPLPGGSWEALCRPASRLRPGTVIDFDAEGRGRLTGEVTARGPEGICHLRLAHQGPLEAVLDAVGHVPLPPYIQRADVPVDRERYQTVYARNPGAVAAPTAGLHFTEEMLTSLASHGIVVARLTLHVGLGTFRPVAVERIEDHVMHAEDFVLPEEAAEAVSAAKARGNRAVAVGTTCARVLETCAQPDGLVVPQSGSTRLFITPGYEFRCVDCLLTNFHLPRSTLLMLVFAMTGVELGQRAYAEAVARRYRFYSYGDAMLIM